MYPGSGLAPTGGLLRTKPRTSASGAAATAPPAAPEMVRCALRSLMSGGGRIVGGSSRGGINPETANHLHAGPPAARARICGIFAGTDVARRQAGRRETDKPGERSNLIPARGRTIRLGGMNEHEEWLRGNTSEDSSGFDLRWAIRMLTCPKAACRRTRRCTGRVYPLPQTCPGLVTNPHTRDELEGNSAVFTRAARRSLAESEDPQGPMQGFNVAWRADSARRTEAAFERAEAMLKAKRREEREPGR